MGARAIENITELQSGTQFGNYRIERKLGAGSMGVVYAATASNLDNRLIALKILPPELMRDQNLLGRFKREASAVVRFSHPHLIQGYDWGEFQKIHYFAMEYLEGESLKQILRNTRRLKTEEALKIVEQITSALKYAGEMGMIHRDIKPENIMITKTGIAKLCDLGLVKSSDDTNQNRLTVIGTVLGTPNYMSPEQASGEEVDIRTDIYSLGVTFFQMLTGTTPFSGKTAAEILAKHIREEPPLLSDLLPDIDIRYIHILDNMMTKKPEERYSPEELLEDILRLRQDHEPKKRSLRVNRSLEQLKGATSRYRFVSVCSKEDIFFGRTLTKNKAITFSKLRDCLDYQERMAQANVALSLEEIFQEKGYITSDQRKMVRQILDRHLQKEEDFLFARVAFDEGFLTESQFQEFLKYHQEHLQKDAPLRTPDFLLQKEFLTPKDLQEIRHLVSVKRGAREDNAFADLTFKAQFLTDGQIRKCFKIQSNNIALYKYRPIKDVMTDKEFLSIENAQVILRALNRSSLTYESPMKLIQQLRLEEDSEPSSENLLGWDAMLENKATNFQALLKQASQLKEQGDYLQAKMALIEALEIDFDHAQARKWLDEIEELLSNAVDLMYEGGRAFDKQNYEKAIRLWEKALKVHPENERMRSKLQEAKKLFLTLKENLRLGTKLFEEKKYKKAFQFFQQVLDVSEHHPIASKHLEACKIFLEQFDELIQFARNHIARQEYAEAIQLYQKALAISPEDSDIPMLIRKATQKLEEQKNLLKVAEIATPQIQQLAQIIEEPSIPLTSETIFTEEPVEPILSIISAVTPSPNTEPISPEAIETVTSPTLEEAPKPIEEEPKLVEEKPVMITETNKEEADEEVSASTANIFEETGVFKMPSMSALALAKQAQESPLEALNPQSPSVPSRIDTSMVLEAPTIEEDVLTHFTEALESKENQSSYPLELQTLGTPTDSKIETPNTPKEPPSLEKPTKEVFVSALDNAIQLANQKDLEKSALFPMEAVSPTATKTSEIKEKDIEPMSEQIFHTGSTMKIDLNELKAIPLGNFSEEKNTKSLETAIEPLAPQEPSYQRSFNLEEDVPSMTKRIFRTGTTVKLQSEAPIEPISLNTPILVSPPEKNSTETLSDPTEIFSEKNTQDTPSISLSAELPQLPTQEDLLPTPSLSSTLDSETLPALPPKPDSQKIKPFLKPPIPPTPPKHRNTLPEPAMVVPKKEPMNTITPQKEPLTMEPFVEVSFNSSTSKKDLRWAFLIIALIALAFLLQILEFL